MEKGCFWVFLVVAVCFGVFLLANFLCFVWFIGCLGLFWFDWAVFDIKKRSNIKRKAKYRLINKYTKSLLQYKKEAARRRRVFELWSRGYSVAQIAVELRTSSRTVNRVRKELSPKIEWQFQVSLDCLVEEARFAVLTPLNGLSISRQTRVINEYFVKQRGLLKRRRKT